LAHSPDSDDAFMFYALATGKIATGDYQFQHILEDIQTLNQAASEGRYVVSAISFHNYPYIADRYQLVSCGGSIGNTYGPIVVSKEAYTPSDFQSDFSRPNKNLRIAVPGERTTAFLALKLFLPNFRYAAVPFEEIIPAVVDGEFDAGLVIHEGQLNFAQFGLKKVVDLGIWWKDETGLPLPLGGNVIRRDIGPHHIQEIAKLLRKSIEFSLTPENHDAALNYALQFARGLDRAHAERFVHMYVNKQTVALDDDCRRGLEALYRRSVEKGFLAKAPVLDVVEV
jgi:1,4-dihydroxy-6-naphthoate synthase